MNLMMTGIAATTSVRRNAGLAAAALLCCAAAWPGIAAATPPSLPPTHFHPFGPPQQLIPDGSVVPLRPVKPLQTMTPMFMLPQNPFGNLGQNFGAMGGALRIEQGKPAPHRQPVELVPPTNRDGAKSARSATSGTSGAASTSAATPARNANVPAHRRPLGW